MILELNTTISDLLKERLLSVRSVNVCRSINCINIADLIEYKDQHQTFLNVKNCGNKSVMEIEQVIYLFKKESKHNIPNSDNNSIEKTSKSSDLSQFFDNDLALMLLSIYNNIKKSSDTLSVSIFEDIFHNLDDFIDELLNNDNPLFCHSKEIDFDDFLIFKELYCVVLSQFQHSLEQRSPHNCIENEILSNAIRIQETAEYRKYDFLLFCNISNNREQIINKQYHKDIDKLSQRTQNAIRRYYPNVKDILPFINNSISYFLSLKFVGKKSAEEIVNILIPSLKYNIENNINKAEINVEEEIKRKNFFYLNNEDYDFYNKYTLKYKKAPYFFLLIKKLQSSDSKTHRIISDYVGLNKNVCKTYDEIAMSFNLSRERIRQIINNKILLFDDILKHIDFFNYNFLSKKILVLNNKDINDTILKEHLQLSSLQFLRLLTVTNDFFITKINDKVVSLPKKFSNKNGDFIYKNIIENNLNGKHTKDCKMKLEDIFPEENEETYDFLKEVFQKFYGIQFSYKYHFIVRKNSIDFENEIFNIIKKNGKPMHIDDIKIKLCYKVHGFDIPNTKQIRSYIHHSSRIVSVGKTSTYALKSWKIFTGTIRDAAYNLLNISPVPIHVNVLLREIKRYYPNIKRNNLLSLLDDRNKKRFVLFEDQLYGLNNKTYPDIYIKKSK